MSATIPLPALVDTHAHLQDPLYEQDLDEVLERAEAAGLEAIVCVGYDLVSSQRAAKLANEHSQIYAGVGIHPNYAASAGDADWAALRELAHDQRVVAVGETGLDNYRAYTPPLLQETWFQRHLDLADELALPVIVHNRQADGRVCEMLSAWKPRRPAGRARGVMHCFSSDEALLKASLGLDFMISFAGTVTFKNAERLRQIVREVPPERLVIETDCPFLAPVPHRGERNEPAYLAYTAGQVAAVRQESLATLAEHTARAAGALFGLDLPVAAPADGA